MIQIVVAGDTVSEGDEEFAVVLSEPKNGVLGHHTATVTILDDDN